MSEYEFVLSSGERIPIIISTRRGLRNITLRPKTRPSREIHISKPWMTPTSAALRFLEQKRRWCERIFTNAPQKIHIAPGDNINFWDELFALFMIHHDVQMNLPIMVMGLQH